MEALTDADALGVVAFDPDRLAREFQALNPFARRCRASKKRFDRWRRGRVGFHVLQQSTNRLHQGGGTTLIGLTEDRHVLIRLCGGRACRIRPFAATVRFSGNAVRRRGKARKRADGRKQTT